MGNTQLRPGIIWVFFFFFLPASLAYSAQTDKLQVAVSILPQSYFAEQIGGDRVEVMVVVPPGSSPATYEPKPSQMVRMERSELYLSIGVPFERAWLDRLRSANERMRVVSCVQGIERRAMQTGLKEAPAASRQSVSARSRSGSKHGEAGLDPHIWLSPPLARIMAMNIRDAFISEDPDHAEVYQARYLELARKINDLDNELLSLFAQSKGNVFLVYHPSWGYFADAYGLRQVTIELEGKQPSPKELSRLIQFARERSIETIFVQPQFSKKSAHTIASSIDADVVALDPLAQDWPDNLARVGERIADALR
jgi:zinc transport system substrate-binding protein